MNAENTEEFNPYTILGVGNSASTQDIKKAYKEKSKELHPDHGGDPQKFADLKKAYDILINPEKKSFYDEYGIDNFLDIGNEAKLVAIQIVTTALERLPASVDMDVELSKIFKKCLDQLKEQEVYEKELRDKLQKRLDGILNKPADDFLTKEIEKVITSHTRAMKQAQLNYMIHDSAYKMVKLYKFDITKIAFNERSVLLDDLEIRLPFKRSQGVQNDF